MRLQSAANISVETLSLARTQEDQHECTAAQRAAQKGFKKENEVAI